MQEQVVQEASTGSEERRNRYKQSLVDALMRAAQRANAQPGKDGSVQTRKRDRIIKLLLGVGFSMTFILGVVAFSTMATAP